MNNDPLKALLAQDISNFLIVPKDQLLAAFKLSIDSLLQDILDDQVEAVAPVFDKMQSEVARLQAENAALVGWAQRAYTAMMDYMDGGKIDFQDFIDSAPDSAKGNE